MLNNFVELKKGEFKTIEPLLLKSGLLGEEFTDNISNSFSKLKHNFNRNKLKVFVGYQKETIISFCIIVLHKNLYDHTAYDWHIAYFYTDILFRRQGLGYKMLTHVYNFLTKTKAGNLSLYTTEDNLPAIALYIKFGFKESNFLGNYNCYSMCLNDYSLVRR
ncbi:GNAT family N-acetyltransferase [Pseudotamlana agarivorans]|uniref:GNAT family N-acetyltransferase n=1 Tax=Pseudotamlana agarivorans TaxID=481183 RepID=UPI00082F5426|nr:GNAT family N-acetyltransferase [Tamlana agarivorans]